MFVRLLDFKLVKVSTVVNGLKVEKQVFYVANYPITIAMVAILIVLKVRGQVLVTQVCTELAWGVVLTKAVLIAESSLRPAENGSGVSNIFLMVETES